jgi:hypothetical protein
MARTNVYRQPTEDDYTSDPHPVLLGWFDDSSAERIEESTYWDGNNRRGVVSGLQCGYEELYRTKGGRWVRHYNARSEFNGPEFYEFLTDEQAQEWLLKDGDDDAVRKYFGEIEEERGPGRPEIGPAFSVRFPADLLARVDQLAGACGLTRAAWLRQVAEVAAEDVIVSAASGS